MRIGWGMRMMKMMKRRSLRLSASWMSQLSLCPLEAVEGVVAVAV
jgi:hypothetical protein